MLCVSVHNKHNDKVPLCDWSFISYFNGGTFGNLVYNVDVIILDVFNLVDTVHGEKNVLKFSCTG